MNSRVTGGRSSWISRWPWIRRMGRVPALRCRSEAFRRAHSVKSCWKSMGWLLLGRFLGRGVRGRPRGLEPEGPAHLGFEIRQDLGIVLEILLGVLAPLPDALPFVRVPGTRLLDDAALGREIQDRALLGDAFAVDHVELRLAERRRELVLDDLDLGADA